MTRDVKSSLEGCSRSEFLERLLACPIGIPGDPAERIKSQIEMWTLQIGLPNAAIILPNGRYSLTERESPDFHLDIDGTTIGIEVTEVLSASGGHARALTHQHFNGCTNFISNAEHEPQAKRDDMMREMQDGGSGFDGRELEIFKCDAILKAIESKSRKLQSSNWTRFDENWLFMYDNFGSSVLDKDFIKCAVQRDMPRGGFGRIAFFKEDQFEWLEAVDQ